MFNAKTISQEKTARIRYIAQDLGKFVSAKVVYQVLLKRGVFKWYANRREIIKLRFMLRQWISECEDYKSYFRSKGLEHKYWQEKGYQKALVDIQTRLKTMIQSSRLNADPRDREATEYLDQAVYGEPPPINARDIVEGTISAGLGS